MTIEDDRELVRRLSRDGFSRNDAAVLREVLAEDFAIRSAGALAEDDGGVLGGREALITGMRHNHASFSGWGFTLREPIAEEGGVVVHWGGSGRHVGSFAGERPTGRTVTLRGSSIFEIREGKIVRDLVFADQAGFRAQIGLDREPDPARGEALVRRFWEEVVNAHDPEAARALMAPDYRQHAAGIDQGPDGFVAFLARLLGESEGMRARVEAVLPAGRLVVSRTTVAFDVPPPGWAASQTIVDVFATDGDTLTEHWDLR